MQSVLKKEKKGCSGKDFYRDFLATPRIADSQIQIHLGNHNMLLLPHQRTYVNLLNAFAFTFCNHLLHLSRPPSCLHERPF